MKPSLKSASKTTTETPQGVDEDKDVEEVEDEQEVEKRPAFVLARDLFELINTEAKATRLLSFVLQELLQYQDDVTEMVASCGSVVEIALEVVPPMKTFVELSIMKGLKQGILYEISGEEDDEDDESLEEGDESVEEGNENVEEGDVVGAVEADKDSYNDADADDESAEKKSEPDGNLSDEEMMEDSQQYDHIPINLEGFLAICMSFCQLNAQSPLHQQLMLLEKKFIPFKKDKTTVGFK